MLVEEAAVYEDSSCLARKVAVVSDMCMCMCMHMHMCMCMDMHLSLIHI